MNNTDNIDSDCNRLDFKPVSKKDINLLNDYFTKYPSRSCDFSIGGVLMWVDYYNYEFALFRDTLFIRGRSPETGTPVYYQPVGILEETEWRRIIACQGYKITDTKLIIPHESAPEDIPEIHFAECSELKEYLYPIENFLGFSGKKMEKKRNHLNYFMNNYRDINIEPVSIHNSGELIEFTSKFAATHNDSPLMRYENGQTIEVLKDYRAYTFDGIAIRIGGKIAGYTFGEKIGDTFFVHVEKGDISYRGVYQALASFMSREINSRHPDVVYLNREEDMGDESLRRSKESYHPSLYIQKRIESVAVLNEKSLLRIA